MGNVIFVLDDRLEERLRRYVKSLGGRGLLSYVASTAIKEYLDKIGVRYGDDDDDGEK